MTVRAWVSHICGGVSAHTGPAPEAKIDRLDYDAYWTERGAIKPELPSESDPWDYPRFMAIAALLSPSERIVDVGCGNGSFLALLRSKGFDNIVGLDVSEISVEALTADGFEAHVAALENVDLHAIGPVDVAVLSEVLEHVTEFESVLASVASQAGRVIVSHPNIGYWPHRMRLLTGRFPVQWGWHPGEHARYLSVTDLLEHVHRSGYEVLSIHAPIGVPSERMRERWPNLLADHVVIELRHPH